jgi:hypothetical protein
MISSFMDLFSEVEKNFHKPDIIDEKKKRHFVDEVMPNVPALTKDEEAMMNGVEGL